MRILRLIIACAALLVASCSSSSSDGAAGGPKTEAEWGDQARPAARQISGAYDALASQITAGEGLPAVHARCRTLGDAAAEAATLPPLPGDNSSKQRHFKHGLTTIIDGADLCAKARTFDDLDKAGSSIEDGLDELRSNVGSFYLT